MNGSFVNSRSVSISMPAEHSSDPLVLKPVNTKYWLCFIVLTNCALILLALTAIQYNPDNPANMDSTGGLLLMSGFFVFLTALTTLLVLPGRGELTIDETGVRIHQPIGGVRHIHWERVKAFTVEKIFLNSRMMYTDADGKSAFLSGYTYAGHNHRELVALLNQRLQEFSASSTMP